MLTLATAPGSGADPAPLRRKGGWSKPRLPMQPPTWAGLRRWRLRPGAPMADLHDVAGPTACGMRRGCPSGGLRLREELPDGTLLISRVHDLPSLLDTA
jgi:hypothetical protein